MSILPEPAWFRNLADSPGDDSPVEASAASPLQTSDEHPDIAEARRIIDKIRATGVRCSPFAVAIPGRSPVRLKRSTPPFVSFQTFAASILT